MRRLRVLCCGGDGTVGTAASALVGPATTLGVLPLGTLNHFARDLRIPFDLPAAVGVVAAGHTAHVDVGLVNGRLFVNNVSLGVYARLVHRREAHRRRRQAFARIRAWAILLTHRQALGITIDAETVETRLVLVANNAYALDLPSIRTP